MINERNTDELYSFAKAAKEIGVSVAHLYELRRRNDEDILRTVEQSVGLGGRTVLRIPRAEVIRLKQKIKN